MLNRRDLALSKLYDALIVGSGASGGWVAKELYRGEGMQVLMLEAGPPRIPSRDFTEHVWPYQLKYPRLRRPEGVAYQDQPVQRSVLRLRRIQPPVLRQRP